jgi:dTMP kinase
VTARPGRLLAVEGIDGSGKSTLLSGLAERWKAEGRSVARWREPTDPRVVDEAATMKDPWRSALLFTVDRAMHRPELESLLSQTDVVSDRSFYSTLAYQGSALSPGPRRALGRLQGAVARRPDLVLLLDASPAVALRRVGRRATGRSGFERLTTLRRVARAYRGLARRGRWIVLDASRPTEEVVGRAVAALRRRRFPRPPPSP